MSNKTEWIAFGSMTLAVVVAYCLIMLGQRAGVKITERKTIEAGYGQYVANPTNGVVTFEFIK